ncbi:MAG TPA: sigma-70 family RNA polymerase sigma factor [Pseudonocardia sp.]
MMLAEAPTRPQRTTPQRTTTELLRAAVSGDRDAWELLMERFEPAVSAVVSSYRLQEADARDVSQRTWMQMFEHHHKIREPEALGGWLRTTAKHECLRVLRDQQRAGPLFDAGTMERPDTTVDVERLVVESEMVRQARGLLGNLPARSVTLISSLFREDPPCYSDLAADTGIPIGSIGPTRARALRSLRQLIEGEPEQARSSRLRAGAL